MTEVLTVFEPGDRFATMARDGRARVLVITDSGIPLPDRADEEPTNFTRAVMIIDQLYDVRAVIRELKSAFARSELDGGVKGVLTHPLYLRAIEEQERLHNELMELI
jgi:hypothetical protein